MQKTFKDYVEEINGFFRENGQQIDPVPEVKIDFTENDRLDPFIKTANYDPETKTITLYVSNRHVKDIMRSYCHELFHHVQNMKDGDGFRSTKKGVGLADNPDLEGIEGDAYVNGNILFRKWTETQKP